jgi:hypothetical protein
MRMYKATSTKYVLRLIDDGFLESERVIREPDDELIPVCKFTNVVPNMIAHPNPSATDRPTDLAEDDKPAEYDVSIHIPENEWADWRTFHHETGPRRVRTTNIVSYSVRLDPRSGSRSSCRRRSCTRSHSA